MAGRILLVLLMVLLLAPAAWGSITITIAPEQTVQGTQLTLGTIAEITGDETDKIKILKALPLGQAPRPGFRLVLTRDLLGARLAATGADFNGITWNIPESISLVTASQLVTAADLTAAAQDAISVRLQLPPDRREVELDSAVSDIAVPLGQVKLSADLPYGIRKSGPTLLNVSVTVDGRLYEKVALRYNIRIYEDVVVASRPIGPHEPFTNENLTLQRMDTARLTGGYVTELNKVIGLNAKRQIAAGTPVTDSLLEKPLLVKRGSTVLIRARSGDLMVAVSGVAMQDGVAGQIIRVQNANSKRILTAKAVEEGVVEILFTK